VAGIDMPTSTPALAQQGTAGKTVFAIEVASWGPSGAIMVALA
jgi:hypothetical protein